MHEIMEKTFILIDALDNSDIIKNIELYKEMINNNDELKKLIQKGNSTIDEYQLMEIKNKLYRYEEYKNYMHYYNELMYIVMEINSRYKRIIGKGSCY